MPGSSTAAASRGLFAGGDARPVRDAVAAFRNVDGGFGQALEPDGRTLASQPASVAILGGQLNEQGQRMATLAPGLSHEAALRRHALLRAMTSAGFVNYPYEWWHYSYGDRYWAYATRARKAIYGGL